MAERWYKDGMPHPDDPFIEEHWPLLLDMAAGLDVVHPTHFGGAPSFWSLYAPIAAASDASVFVVAQLGQSLDGRIATASGHSQYINGPEAIRHLHRLRALVDAVVVGIGTVIADNPRLTVRETEGPNPARIVIDPNFRLPADACMLADDGAPVFAIQGCNGDRPSCVSKIVIASHDGVIAPTDIIAALMERGFRRILIEGGASTVSAFLSAGVIDRLHISVAPILIGSGPIGVTLPPIDHMDGAKRPGPPFTGWVRMFYSIALFKVAKEQRRLAPLCHAKNLRSATQPMLPLRALRAPACCR